MNKIFIEAKKKETTEYHFIKTILDVFFPKKKVDFIFMDGIGNLYNETILNQMRLAQDNGEQIILLTDADTKEKGVGSAKRKVEIDNGMNAHSLSFPYFIYPNNQDDGDIENLMFIGRDELTSANSTKSPLLGMTSKPSGVFNVRIASKR